MIEANIKARAMARQAIEFITDCHGELLDECGEDALPAFYAVIREAFKERFTVVVEPPFPEPMTDQQAGWFGSRPMPWGQYEGTRIDEVPLNYLDWVVSQPDEFKADLNRYLRSRWVRVTRDNERDESEDD